MATRLTTHLMFLHEDAGEALALYAEAFDDFEVLDLQRYGPEDAGREGTVAMARFRLAGSELTCIDSPVAHDFDFTPAMSLFVDCADEAELERVHALLVAGGQELMPLGDYGFSTRFGWVNDRFGVSWQLNLP